MNQRTDWLSKPGLAVVKVGTNVLADARGHLDTHRIQQLADQLQRWIAAGWKVALVSSGAIGAGVGKLNLGKRPTDLPHLQACAAVGQTALMQEYIRAFAPHGLIPAQMLLTGFLKPGGVVLFDDYRYGLSSIYDPDALLADPRLYKTLGVVAVLWLLYAVGRSRRMLAVRVPEPRPSSATFARAISDFYARSLSNPEMAEALGAHFLGSARRAYGISGTDAEVWARLKREGGLDTTAVNAAEKLSFGSDSGRDNSQMTTLILALERRFRR